MLNALSTQQRAPAVVQVSVEQTRGQLREQVREQAREQARIIQEQVRAATQGIPGTGDPTVIVQPSRPPFAEPYIPHEAVQLSIVLFSILALIIVTWPIMRAFARRMDRAAVAPPGSPELMPQLQRIEQAVEAISVEVERISEAQRYMARLQTERAADSAALRPPMS